MNPRRFLRRKPARCNAICVRRLKQSDAPLLMQIDGGTAIAMTRRRFPAYASKVVRNSEQQIASIRVFPGEARDSAPSILAPGACAALRSASRSVTRLYDLVLAPTGLKATQFIMLRAIHDAGEIAQRDLARQNAVAVETLSRRFAGLRRKGWIELRIGKNHAERLYVLTDRGRKVLRSALPSWDLAQRRLRFSLGEDDWMTLFGISRRICLAARTAEQLRINNYSDATLPIPEKNLSYSRRPR